MGWPTWVPGSCPQQPRLCHVHQEHCHFVSIALQTNKINELANPYAILTLQEELKTLLKEFELQEAVTTIGVQCIIDNIEEQNIKKINEDYFGYVNQPSKCSLHTSAQTGARS
jgi:hypothetical protein